MFFLCHIITSWSLALRWDGTARAAQSRRPDLAGLTNNGTSSVLRVSATHITTMSSRWHRGTSSSEPALCKQVNYEFINYFSIHRWPYTHRGKTDTLQGNSLEHSFCLIRPWWRVQVLCLCSPSCTDLCGCSWLYILYIIYTQYASVCSLR